MYQEWFASGHSTKYILIELGGGGTNCVRLVITKDLLWVTSWFPFSFFAPAYDMEHVIPLDGITEVEHNRGFVKGVRLTYVSENGAVRSLELVPINQEGFLRAEPSQSQSRLADEGMRLHWEPAIDYQPAPGMVLAFIAPAICAPRLRSAQTPRQEFCL